MPKIWAGPSPPSFGQNPKEQQFFLGRPSFSLMMLPLILRVWTWPLMTTLAQNMASQHSPQNSVSPFFRTPCRKITSHHHQKQQQLKRWLFVLENPLERFTNHPPGPTMLSEVNMKAYPTWYQQSPKYHDVGKNAELFVDIFKDKVEIMFSLNSQDPVI